MLISLFAVGSVGFINENWFYDNGIPFHHLTAFPLWVESIILFFLIAIPFFFLFILGMKILSPQAKLLGRTANLSLFGIWLVALLVTIFMATKVYMHRAFTGNVIETRELPVPVTDTLQIRMIDNSDLSGNMELKRRWGESKEVVFDGESKLYSNNLKLNIKQSDSDKVYVKIKKRSKGKSNLNAKENAAGIAYRFELQDDALNLDGYFLADEGTRLLDQRVYVDVYLPEGTVIYLDKSSASFLDFIELDGGNYGLALEKHYYKMTDNGLKCLDCPEMESNDEIETTKPESFQMQIDKKGVKVQVTNAKKEKALVKIDENGVHIETVEDSLK